MVIQATNLTRWFTRSPQLMSSYQVQLTMAFQNHHDTIFLVPTSGQPDDHVHTTQPIRQMNYDIFNNPSRQYHNLWHQYGLQNSGMFQPTTVTLSQVLPSPKNVPASDNQQPETAKPDRSESPNTYEYVAPSHTTPGTSPSTSPDQCNTSSATPGDKKPRITIFEQHLGFLDPTENQAKILSKTVKPSPLTRIIDEHMKKYDTAVDIYENGYRSCLITMSDMVAMFIGEYLVQMIADPDFIGVADWNLSDDRITWLLKLANEQLYSEIQRHSVFGGGSVDSIVLLTKIISSDSSIVEKTCIIVNILRYWSQGFTRNFLLIYGLQAIHHGTLTTASPLLVNDLTTVKDRLVVTINGVIFVQCKNHPGINQLDHTYNFISVRRLCAMFNTPNSSPDQQGPYILLLGAEYRNDQMVNINRDLEIKGQVRRRGCYYSFTYQKQPDKGERQMADSWVPLGEQLVVNTEEEGEMTLKPMLLKLTEKYSALVWTQSSDIRLEHITKRSLQTGFKFIPEVKQSSQHFLQLTSSPLEEVRFPDSLNDPSKFFEGKGA